MEPAIAMCTATTVITLGLWLVGQAHRALTTLPDCLARSLIGAAPRRAVVTAVLATVGFVAVSRPSAAEPIPPIVRLTEGVADPDPASQEVAGGPTYEVVRGDSLWCIAGGVLEGRTGRRPPSVAIADFWPRIYEANRTLIGEDPDLIFPGQRLIIPEQ